MSTGERRFDPQHRQALPNAQRQARRDLRRFLARLDLRAGRTVLDPGCGPGLWTLPLAEFVGPSGPAWALAVSQVMLNALAARQPSLQGRLLHGELPAINLPDASVDWIWDAFVFHEVDLPAQLAAELRRVVRPKGRVVTLDWRPGAEGQDDPPRSHRLGLDQVSGYSWAAGFQIVAQTWQDENAYLTEAR